MKRKIENYWFLSEKPSGVKHWDKFGKSKGIEDKSSTLESKLSWAVDQKRLKSDRNTEIFIIALTVLQALSGFGLGIKDMSKPYVWPIMLLGLIILIIYRMRD